MTEEIETLRDKFATAAMAGMLASPELMEIVTAKSIVDGSALKRIAVKAYEQADAMLEARR